MCLLLIVALGPRKYKVVTFYESCFMLKNLQRRSITSIYQEPAFQELILLYTDESAQREVKDKAEMLPLQLKIYEKIPIPDLPVSVCIFDTFGKANSICLAIVTGILLVWNI